MTQFFDALERQLVALSSEAPRMTPRARARRRLAIGTVTALSLLAVVAGTSMLPHLVREPSSGNDALLAQLRSNGRPRAIDGAHHKPQASVGETLDAGYSADACGQEQPVKRSTWLGRSLDVVTTTGRLDGLVCSMRLAAASEHGQRSRACDDRSSPQARSRFVDDVDQTEPANESRGSHLQPCQVSWPHEGTDG